MNRFKAYVLTLAVILLASPIVAHAGNNLAVRLVGTAVGETRLIEVGDGSGGVIEALCFDLELRELNTDMPIGNATDCLSDITPVGDGLALTGTTIFDFHGGTLVNRGSTTVQPVTIGSPEITHITGAIPGEGERTIIPALGTGRFKDRTGYARLSGAVAMVNLPSGELQITFDCIFVIDLDKGKSDD